MSKHWILKAHDPVLIRRIEKAADVSPVVAQLLAVRGLHDPVAIRQFVDAPFTDLRSPSLLPGVDAAAERILQAIAAGDKITIYGDYDCDGMTASAILIRGIRLLGGNVHSFVPSRIDDGYGLSDDALERLAKSDTRLVVTVDCGIASVHEAATAKRLGMDLIVTDHHEFGSELPAATAIVHPRLPGHAYPFDGLCGAGVALKLAWALCQKAGGTERVSEAHRRFLLVALGLAAIGTVADVVPLVDENRLIVRHGLTFLRHETVPGLGELMKLCGLADKPALEAEDIGFSLGPRLNAAGRLGQAQLAVELLTSDSETRTAALADYIHQLNSSRESLERKIQKSALSQIEELGLADDPAIVLADRDWHVGVIGIVAGRIAEKYHRPTVLIARDESGSGPGTGSGRSACGINLFEALTHCRDHLAGFGGHAAAAGIQIDDDAIDAFREAFVDYVASNVTAEDLQERLEIDLEAPLSHFTLTTVGDLERLAPFGAGNRRPVFCTTNVSLCDAPQRMGGGGRHVSMRLQQQGVKLRCVAFGKGDWADQMDPDRGRFDVAFRPVINQFAGRRNVELHLVDWRPTKTEANAMAVEQAGHVWES